MSTETADPRFDSVDDVRDRLRKVDYLSDESIAGIVYLADRLGKRELIDLYTRMALQCVGAETVDA